MQDHSKRPTRRVVLLACGAALTGALWTGPAMGAGLGEERLTALRGTVLGTVVAVDAAGRKLTVRGPRGEFPYRVDPKVTNLEAIKVGETVRVDFVAGIGLTVRRGSGAPAAAPATGKGPAAGERIKGVLRVLAIDQASQTVRLKGAKGDEADFHVRDKADMVGVKVGDRVVAVIYELVAGAVEPATR